MEFYREVIDITHQVNGDMITWRNEKTPFVEQYMSIEKGDVCNTSKMTIDLHAGTHIDAPSHFINGGKTLDEIDVETLMGDAYVAEIGEDIITASLLKSIDIPVTERLLFKTTNVELYKRGTFTENFVTLDTTAAEWILDRGIKLVGVDYLSVEKPDSEGFPVHRLLLENGIVIVEGLKMEGVVQGRYFLVVLPLKLEGVEASPVRALLMR